MDPKRVLLLIFLFLTLTEIPALDNHAVAGGAAPPALEFDSDLSPTSWAWMGDPKNPRYQQVKQIHNRFVDFICDHPKLKKHIVSSRFGANKDGDLVFTVEIGHGWWEEVKKHLPVEFEGIPVEIRESLIEASGLNALCMRKVSSWIGDENNPRYQKVKGIYERLVDSICDWEEVKKHVVFSEIKADDHGDPVFWVGVKSGWLKETQKRLPREFEGIPVESFELAPQFSKMIPFCSRHLVSWIGDSTNPRYQELVKIHQRFSDFLGERLEPYEQLVSTGIGADEHGNPVFHVGVRPEWLEEAKRRIPPEFEGITVELEGCGPVEFFKKK